MNAFLASVEIFLAAVILHKAVPTVLQNGRIKALNIWALGVALGLFAVDRITASTAATSAVMGHAMLILYGALRYTNIARRGLICWGQQKC